MKFFKCYGVFSMQRDPVYCENLGLISIARSPFSVALLNVSQQCKIINKSIFEFYWNKLYLDYII